MIQTKEDIKKLGTVMGIWAHPDDDAFSAAGLMKLALENGQKVISVVATRGDAGQTADDFKWPQKSLSRIREQEQISALQVLGNIELIWLDYADGTLRKQNRISAVDQIVTILNTHSPDTVISFGLDGITGHDDHKAVHSWVKSAVAQAKKKLFFYGAKLARENLIDREQLLECDAKFNIFFNIDHPEILEKNETDIYLELNGELLESKIKCLKQHASQTATMFDKPDLVDCLVRVEAFVEY